MKYLLDSHTFLWFVVDAPELSSKAKSLLLNSENQIWVSIASFWEISIKNSLGKLRLEVGYQGLLEEANKNEFEILPIGFEHTVLLNGLDFHHRDPFDRMIIAQAITENMNIVGVDQVFDAYLNQQSIQRIW
ncbi:MAG: type II toxin-antitoxin system VapC family toxin [Bacteroidetes bacterium]|nr:type II toxin-antitoxin system VapC family toxin [Bacteroidota bacterium]